MFCYWPIISAPLNNTKHDKMAHLNLISFNKSLVYEALETVLQETNVNITISNLVTFSIPFMGCIYLEIRPDCIGDNNFRV